MGFGETIGRSGLSRWSVSTGVAAAAVAVGVRREGQGVHVGTRVAEGGTAVALGVGVSAGTAVADGGTAVLVGVRVGVSVGTGVGLAVGGIGVSVGTTVAEGGTGVPVGVRVSLATGAKISGDIGVSSGGASFAGTALRDAAEPSGGCRPVSSSVGIEESVASGTSRSNIDWNAWRSSGRRSALP